MSGKSNIFHEHVQFEFVFRNEKMKRFEKRKLEFQKVTFHKIMNFANFKNGGNDIKWDTM